jgi:long-subunit fatty acid transport protein
MWSQYDRKKDGLAGPDIHDILIPRLGFEYELNGWWDLRLGMQYAPNAIYAQNSETNYVDNDRISGSLGMQFELPWPKKARLDLHFQFSGLVSNTYRKDDAKMIDEFPVVTNEETDETVGDERLQTNNPGYPGYESRGFLLAFGTALTVPF